ncbi:MAG: ABC transporter permease [Candidatus Micrarchaeota archaeon]|nr:ABC transporter permease [Candidatus Micrarchaeota archaeon]
MILKLRKEFFVFFFNEFKNIIEVRYLLSILITLLITVALSNTMLDISKAFKEGELASALPIVTKLATLGIVNDTERPLINEIQKSNSLYVIYYDSLDKAYIDLNSNLIHAVLIINNNSITLVLGNNKMNTFIEQVIRTTIDKHLRKDSPAFELKDDVGLEELLKGILLPIMLFSPLFLFSIPIIQSVAYDRENKLLEILYTLNISKSQVYLGKLFAAIIFSSMLCFLWLLILQFVGYKTYNFIEVYIIVVCVAALIVSINGMISTISSSVQEASLSASIVSTIIFVILFGSMLFKLIKPLESISNLTPTTYISSSVSQYQTNFPFFPLFFIIVLIAVFVLMGTAAFITEKFAFSQKPGIDEIFTGTMSLIHNDVLRRIIAALFSYIITIPIQVLLVLTIFFLAFSIGFYRFLTVLDLFAIIAIVLFSSSEELMKGYSVRAIINSKSNATKFDQFTGLKEGFYIGLLFGVFELLTFILLANVSADVVLRRLLFPRLVALVIHTLSSSVLGAMLASGNSFTKSFFFASIIHSFYNLTLYARMRNFF